MFESIKEDFQKVIEYSQGIYEPKVDEIFDTWYENKKYFINNYFDGNLIYEVPQEVSFEMTHKDKIKKIDEFITHIDFNTYRSDFYPDKKDSFLYFLEEVKKDFYTNTVSEDFKYQDIFIQKNSKIVKSFKYFIQDKDVLSNLQSEASRIIQKDKIKGKLCFSVHPLDFLSLSENDCGWRSCHALDGEYRAGNISYMLDKTTIICYLKSNEDALLPNFPIKWNSKKWRVLLFFSDSKELLFAGRQYPFASENGMDIVLKEIQNKTVSFGEKWSEWDNQVISSFSNKEGFLPLNDRYISLGGVLKGYREIIKDHPRSLAYNDLLKSHYYKPMYSAIIRPFRDISLPFISSNETVNIGNGFKCMCCGEHYVEIPSIFRCIPCEEKFGTEDNEYFTNCRNCGRRMYIEDMQEFDYEMYCEDCYNEVIAENESWCE